MVFFLHFFSWWFWLVFGLENLVVESTINIVIFTIFGHKSYFNKKPIKIPRFRVFQLKYQIIDGIIFRIQFLSNKFSIIYHFYLFLNFYSKKVIFLTIIEPHNSIFFSFFFHLKQLFYFFLISCLMQYYWFFHFIFLSIFF